MIIFVVIIIINIILADMIDRFSYNLSLQPTNTFIIKKSCKKHTRMDINDRTNFLKRK